MIKLPFVLSIMLLVTVSIAPVHASSTTVSALPTGAGKMGVITQTTTTQSVKPDSSQILYLDEERVSFLLACRCTPDKLP
jgi:secreted trypsin-like serine protease